MSRMNRRITLCIVAAVGITFLGAALARRARREAPQARKPVARSGSVDSVNVEETLASMRTPPPPPPPFRSVDVVKQGRDLHDGTLLDVIRIARTAARENNLVARAALVSGLRKEAPRARTLIEQERARAACPADAEALTALLNDLR